jgi:OmpA-OmpF porin, OOP family
MPVEEDVDFASGARGGVDEDADRIVDRDDQCRTDAEDRDGFQDEDGCPDPDDDQDRIADEVDRCRGEPETYNGTDDDDGCPDRPCVRVTQSADCIVVVVSFENGSADLAPASIALVDSIAQVMIAQPEIQIVEVRGHADPGEPVAIAATRASVVHTYLVERGIAATRLVQRSYGSTEVRDRARTAEARARNRRVDFRIVTQQHEGLATGEAELSCSPVGVVYRPRSGEPCRE